MCLHDDTVFIHQKQTVERGGGVQETPDDGALGGAWVARQSNSRVPPVMEGGASDSVPRLSPVCSSSFPPLTKTKFRGGDPKSAHYIQE